MIVPSDPKLTIAFAVVPPPYTKLPGMSAGGGSISSVGLLKNFVVGASTSTLITSLTVSSGYEIETSCFSFRISSLSIFKSTVW